MSTLFMSTDSCPSDSCQAPFMSDPIHVRLDRFMSGLIHARTYSCQALFMSDLIHVQKTDSCQALFMSDPIHVLEYLFMSDLFHVNSHSCQMRSLNHNITKPQFRILLGSRAELG